MARFPDVFIIGKHKCGTSSLYRWLSAQPEFFDAGWKEPKFFSGKTWGRGLDWYTSIFAGAQPDQLTIEASQPYTDPAFTDTAARRIAEHAPAAKLVYVVRHPEAQIRSRYRYRHQKDEEQRPLADRLSTPDNDYVRGAMYHACLRPYIDRFPADQMFVARFEDLFGPGEDEWNRLLAFLGLGPRTRPTRRHNATDQWRRPTAPMRLLRRLRVRAQVRRVVPKPMRRIGRLALTRPAGGRITVAAQLGAAPLPPGALDAVWDDIAELEAWLGRTLWDRSSAVPHG